MMSSCGTWDFKTHLKLLLGDREKLDDRGGCNFVRDSFPPCWLMASLHQSFAGPYVKLCWVVSFDMLVFTWFQRKFGNE